MFNNIEFVLTKEYLLNRVSEEDIFQKYLGIRPDDKGTYANPLRSDKHPGCSFYINEQGRWKFKDFAGRFNWDCFNVVEYIENCSFKEALIKVAIDFDIVKGTKTNIVINKKTKASKEKIQLRVKRRSWTTKDIEYWNSYGITEETLSIGNVYPISNAWFLENGTLRPAYFYKEQDPAYVYHFYDYEYKIYMPFKPKGYRFLQGANKDILQGQHLLPQAATNLLITKSYKDVLTLYAYYHKFDLYSIAPLSEYIIITLEQFKELYNRFNNIATLFDFDRTGISLMRKYESIYKLPFYIFGKEYKVQGIKDFADYRKLKGDYMTNKLIEQYIKPLY